MNAETLKLTVIIGMMISILWAGLTVYKAGEKAINNTSDRLEQVYNW